MKGYISILILISFLLKTSVAASQDTRKTSRLNPSMWDEYPWNGQGGIKLVAGTHNQLFFEIAYMKSDLPKQNSRKRIHDYDYLFGNQNIYGGLEFTKAYNDFFIAPKIGYEFNLIVLTGRISSVNYFSFRNKNVDSRLLLEPGLTICGFVGLHYGYSIPLSKTENITLGRHRVSATVNYFDMWRNKNSKNK